MSKNHWMLKKLYCSILVKINTGPLGNENIYFLSSEYTWNEVFFVHNFLSIFPDILVIKEMHPPVPVDSIHLSSLVRITISSLFTCYQRHNLGVFQSHAINATTRLSSNLMLSPPPPGFRAFTCCQRRQPVCFPSHAINATTRVSSNHMLSTPPPGLLSFTCYQRQNPGVFPSMLSTLSACFLPFTRYQGHNPGVFVKARLKFKK